MISPTTRSAFREFCSAWLVLRTIGDAFEGHGFAHDFDAQANVGGERRTYVEEFHATIDWSSPGDTRRFLHVIEDALAMARSSAPDEVALRDDLGRLVRALDRDGFTLELDSLTIDAHVGLTVTELDAQQLLNLLSFAST